MTFAVQEISTSDGRPLELIELNFAQFSWYYCTAEEAITYNGNTYLPIANKRTPLTPTGDTTKSSLTVNVPYDTPIGDLFKAQPPSGIVTITLYAAHYLDNDFKVIWKGRVINVQWNMPWLVLTTESVLSSLQRIGLRRKFSAQCPHPLYGEGCFVSDALFKEILNVASISGNAVILTGAAGKPTDYYAGGYLTWTSSIRSTVERRMIRASNFVTGAISLVSAPSGLGVGQVTNIFPGCDHSLGTCNSKFANSLNFGGTPFIPSRNPFSGTTLY